MGINHPFMGAEIVIPYPQKKAMKTVSLLIETQQSIYDNMQKFLDQRTDWSQERLVNVALAQFLLQNSVAGTNPGALSKVFLDMHPEIISMVAWRVSLSGSTNKLT